MEGCNKAQFILAIVILVLAIWPTLIGVVASRWVTGIAAILVIIAACKRPMVAAPVAAPRRRAARRRRKRR